MIKGTLAKENKQDKYKQQKEPIHKQVQGVIFILIKNISESFQGCSCCTYTKIQNLKRRR